MSCCNYNRNYNRHQCCNSQCCCSINSCCTCVSPWDRCGRLNIAFPVILPLPPVRRITLTNPINYAYFTNTNYSVLATNTDIPLTTNVINGTAISLSGSTITLAPGNYEVIFTASVYPVTQGLTSGNLGLKLNSALIAVSNSTTSYVDGDYTTFSGNAIVQANTTSTLNVTYTGDVTVTLYNVKVTIKMLP